MGADTKSPSIDFNRDIRPILSNNCFGCHGRDAQKRQAGLRLDVREQAIKTLESGATAVSPKRADQSELLSRVTSADADLRMPPADSGAALSAQQIELLKLWIEQGARYAPHWAFVKPQRPALPEVEQQSWPKNGIDYFILARLEAEGLAPSPEADRYMLIRRLSLDLRGLPPSPEEVRRFVNDKSPDAYELLVNRLLADPAYGERWAGMWLDLARYADSKGYGSDPLRTIWRYRDWVIEAYNANLPYDRFTLEQLAGDLLPSATLEQRVATAMHRNTMTNTEGGTDDEEFRVAAVRDRVDTTMQVWMGLTMGCAKCHSHKFDPVSQREYYEFYAFFNQTADADRPDESPTITAPTRELLQENERIDRRVAAMTKKLETSTPQLNAEQGKWEAELLAAAASEQDRAAPARFVRIELPGKQRMLSLAEVQVFVAGQNVAPNGKARQVSTAYDGPARLAIDGDTNGDYFAAKSTTHTAVQSDPWWEVDLGADKALERIVIWNRTDGNLQSRLANFRVLTLDAKRQTVWRTEVAKYPNPSQELTPRPGQTAPRAILDIVKTPAPRRTDKQRTTLSAYYRTVAPSLNAVREEIARLKKSKPEPPTVPVMQELPPEQRRETHVMIKGNFLSLADAVEAGVPSAFHAWPSKAPLNRLGLAHWIMDADNPLTARVAVNRFWGQLFGVGLVETEEDFGTQGSAPSHQRLLDWLATEFQRLGWDQKALLRRLVTSAAYRQTSRLTPELLQRDPRNRLLSRGPRFRLKAEMVRDQALALSGLLSHKQGGPSVYPPQPPDLWRAAFNGRDRKWETSAGEDRYRRGLYTFWRRTIPYPSMMTFDAPSREICSMRRIRTNTPLQAFVTLNDPVYVEAAQALARRIMTQGGDTPESRTAFALQLCLVRPPSSQQVQSLVELYRSEAAHFRGEPAAALKMAAEPLGPLPVGLETSEAASWTVVANVLLNLDGVLMKN